MERMMGVDGVGEGGGMARCPATLERGMAASTVGKSLSSWLKWKMARGGCD